MEAAPDSPGPPPGRLTSAQGFAMAIAALGTTLLLTLCAQLPASVAPSWLHRYESVYRTVWPQGWDFFDSTANQPSVSVFPVAGDGRISSPLITPFVSGHDPWGLNRSSQAVLTEALYLGSQVPGKAWIPCRASAVQSCVGRAGPIHLVNSYRPALICGLNLLVAQQHPAALGAGSAPAGSASAVLATVSCPR